MRGRSSEEGVQHADRATTSTPRTALLALGVYVVLRCALPGNLVISPLGQVGAPASVWGLVCLLLWLGGAAKQGRPRRLFGATPMHWAFSLLAIAWLVSYAVLPVRMPELFERNGADANLIEMLSMVGVGLLAADGIATRTQFVSLGRVVCTVWGISSAVALLQFRGVDLTAWLLDVPGLRVAGETGALVERGSFNRATGTTMHPIEFSVMTAMVVPLVLQLQPHAPNRRRWNALVLITVLGIPISLSRSGFVGLAVGLVVLAISWPAERLRRKLVQGFVLALVLFVAVPGLTGTITNMFTGVSSDNSITTRTSDYAAVQPYIEARPIFGRGVGTFTPPHYRILDNQYLLTLIEAGAAGLAALITFVVVSALTAQQGWNRAPPGASRDLARAVFASILVAATSLAFFDGFSFHGFSGLFFLLAGMGGAAWRLASAESDRAFLRPGG